MCQQQEGLRGELSALKRSARDVADPGAEVAAGMQLLRRLTGLARDEADRAARGGVFGGVNVRLFLRFREVQHKKRKLNNLAGGIMTFGSAEPPIALYQGPTRRDKIKGPAGQSPAGLGSHEPLKNRNR